MQVVAEAVKGSKMLKVSKDGLSIKRRVPFDTESLDKKHSDACTIYAENYPTELSID